jgi:hypothetical protein
MLERRRIWRRTNRKSSVVIRQFAHHLEWLGFASPDNGLTESYSDMGSNLVGLL